MRCEATLVAAAVYFGVSSCKMIQERLSIKLSVTSTTLKILQMKFHSVLI